MRTDEEMEAANRAIDMYESEIRYTERELADMGGAENEDTEILTEATVSESPQFNGKFGCVTGL
jgi:hypothetical protein